MSEEKPSCPRCGESIGAQSADELAKMIARFRTPPGFSPGPLEQDLKTLLRSKDKRIAELEEAHAHNERVILICNKKISELEMWLADCRKNRQTRPHSS